MGHIDKSFYLFFVCIDSTNIKQIKRPLGGMNLEDFIAEKKRCWRPCPKSRTRVLTLPSFIMIRYPKIQDTAYDLYYNTETGEVIYRPCKEEK